jgi:hypothetical protein
MKIYDIAAWPSLATKTTLIVGMIILAVGLILGALIFFFYKKKKAVK